MATFRREWVSVEQAQQWIDTYDPRWMSREIVEAIKQEVRAGKKLRWYHAIIIDQQTNVCHDSLSQLLAIVQAQRGQMCWIGRANDFHFSEAEIDGDRVLTRKMDTVEEGPILLPLRRIGAETLRCCGRGFDSFDAYQTHRREAHTE